ncbi:hypothetical protein P168DRAFT_34844 [Aspergillus campestris IBT 28561]|uniref:Uncharacterized protein n=1 Tax=Aspergillus campestris (strain IBT 28561) TaxID=1392248 RepID=A0A2I1DHI3_ASPC2|nr:uncharacterized protein P168DRAFT_34844 [Aspergillus campestris IBT 28561]PKY09327.1 hypothetical protein P168DRAFT_34844 [Aspergillus campestris IBT 28561]
MIPQGTHRLGWLLPYEISRLNQTGMSSHQNSHRCIASTNRNCSQSMQMKIVGRKTPTGPPTVQCSIPGCLRSLPAFSIAICHLPPEILSLVSCQQITIRKGGMVSPCRINAGALSGQSHCKRCRFLASVVVLFYKTNQQEREGRNPFLVQCTVNGEPTLPSNPAA